MSKNAGEGDRKGIFLISALAGIIGGLCCVTPIVLVMLGLASLAVATVFQLPENRSAVVR